MSGTNKGNAVKTPQRTCSRCGRFLSKILTSAVLRQMEGEGEADKKLGDRQKKSLTLVLLGAPFRDPTVTAGLEDIGIPPVCRFSHFFLSGMVAVSCRECRQALVANYTLEAKVGF